MKDYDYRDYYELGERLLLNGETVEVVIDECACNGCHLSGLFNVSCSAYCSGIERKDGNSICFQLVDTANTPGYPEYDPNKEYTVYERFQYNGVVAECRECISPLLCRSCVFYPCNGDNAKAGKCMASSRKDNTRVYYKALTDVRP